MSNVPSWINDAQGNIPQAPQPNSQAPQTRTPEQLSRQKHHLNKRLEIVYASASRAYTRSTDLEELRDSFQIATSIRQKWIEDILHQLKASQNAELCFLVDVTGSMQSHINAVRDQIIVIVDRLTKPQGDEESTVSGMKLAFIGYRDLGDAKRFETISFTEDPNQLKDFCKSVIATGGADGPEDVFGGMDQMLKLPWSQPQDSTKVVFHIADAPCHGKEFHSMSDDYPDGDPEGRTHTDLFRQIREKNIQYYFGKITSNTDTMIKKFATAYGETILDFNVKDVSLLKDSVVDAVTHSVGAHISKTLTGTGSKIPVCAFEFEKEIPDFKELPLTEVYYITYRYPKSINDIIDDVPLERNNPIKTNIKIAAKPFSQGSERVAFYGVDCSYIDSTDEPDPIVFKEYKHVEKKHGPAYCYEICAEIQTIASFLANEFSRRLEDHFGTIGQAAKMEFLEVRAAHIPSADDNHRNLTWERYFTEDYTFIRFSNNVAYQMTAEEAKKKDISIDLLDLVMAFSHWTHTISNGYLMVVDLEGIIPYNCRDGKVVTLTDPAIHCKDLTKFGCLNFGEQGMKVFFDKHKCNKFCQALELDQ